MQMTYTSCFFFGGGFMFFLGFQGFRFIPISGNVIEIGGFAPVD